MYRLLLTLGGCILLAQANHPIPAIFLAIVALAKTRDVDPPSATDPPLAVLLLPLILGVLVWAFKDGLDVASVAALVAYAAVVLAAKSSSSPDAVWIMYLTSILVIYARHADPPLRLALMALAVGNVATRYAPETAAVWADFSSIAPLMLSFL